MIADPDSGFARTALRLASPVIVWALHFAVIYGYTALACARGFAGTAAWVVGTATLAAALVALAILVTHLSTEFSRWLTACLAGAALIAIVWEGLTPLLVRNPCA